MKYTNYDIIRRPVVTEKSMAGMNEKKYTFIVDIHANKSMIKKAVEDVFGVSVENVTTARYIGKKKKSWRSYWKKSGFQKSYCKT